MRVFWFVLVLVNFLCQALSAQEEEEEKSYPRVDLGGQIHAKQRAHDVAAEAARAGGEQVKAAPAIEGRYVSVDTNAAGTAAQQYLAAAGVTGTVTITGGDTVHVEVTDTYTPKFLSFIGIGDLTVTSDASARIVRSLGGTEQ